MSFAGVQEKLPVFVNEDDAISIAIDGTPSTPYHQAGHRASGGKRRKRGVLRGPCKGLWIGIGEATIAVAGKRRYLLVKRYDRFTDPQGEIRRLHQENLCQLTGHFPPQKYERSSTGHGVTLKMMFDAVGDLVSPSERLKLLDAVIFNVVICNSDSHAKNYAILIGAGGSARMTPLYDVMCAAVYGQVDQSLLQSISGRFIAPDLRRADWQAFAEDIGLSRASTIKRVEEIAELTSATCTDVAKRMFEIAGDPTRILKRITHSVQKRCRRIREQL